MASAQGSAPDAPAVPEPEGRRPWHSDPLVAWGAALSAAALTAFWFFFLRTPTVRLGQAIARLTAAVGEVKRKPVAQTAWATARLADRLHVGDRLQTESRGAAEITFDAGSVVRVRPDSVVYLGGSAESSTAAWRVQTGRVQFASGNRPTEIITPTARTTAEANSAGNIEVAGSGATGVKVFQGEARVQTTSDQQITLRANEAVQVDPAGRAGAKVALPSPPTLVAPTARAQLPLGAPAQLVWTPVTHGATYRLAVDYNVMQADLLLAAALDAPGIASTSHTLEGLEVGRYYWRVAAVTEDGLEGAFSRASLFAVVPAPPSPGPTPSERRPALSLTAVEEVSPGVVYIQGSTDPDAAVSVDDVPVRVMPDGSFAEYVRGVGPEQVMVSARVGGLVTERSHAVVRRP